MPAGLVWEKEPIEIKNWGLFSRTNTEENPNNVDMEDRNNTEDELAKDESTEEGRQAGWGKTRQTWEPDSQPTWYFVEGFRDLAERFWEIIPRDPKIFPQYPKIIRQSTKLAGSWVTKFPFFSQPACF